MQEMRVNRSAECEIDDRLMVPKIDIPFIGVTSRKKETDTKKTEDAK